MKKRQTWKMRVREVYASLPELRAYNSIYGVAKRCGYRSAAKMWAENPLIGGSVDPRDFGRAV